MEKKNYRYESPATSVVEIKSGRLICASNPEEQTTVAVPDYYVNGYVED